jgi:hypothetical protein
MTKPDALPVSGGFDADGPRTLANHALTVSTDAGTYPVLSATSSGLVVRASDAPRLSGFVEVRDGTGNLARCLVMLTEEENGVRHYEFKQRTLNRTVRALYHAQAQDAGQFSY